MGGICSGVEWRETDRREVGRRPDIGPVRHRRCRWDRRGTSGEGIELKLPAGWRKVRSLR